MAPKPKDPSTGKKGPGLLSAANKKLTNLLKRGNKNGANPASPTAAEEPAKKPDPSNGTQQPEPASPSKEEEKSPPPPPAAAPEENKDPVALIFNFLYTIIAIIGVVMVVVLFAMSTVDLLTIITKTIMQHIDLMNNPNMYNINTLDFETLLYFRNSRDTEPNTIFKQQDVLTGMFSVGFAFFFTIAFQIILFVTLLIIYKFIKGKPLTFGKFEFMNNRLAFIGIILTVATAMTALGVYKGMFLKSVQPAITTTRSNLDVIKNFIYNNLTNNEAFLTALVNGNLTGCTAIINQQTSLARISRMLYTMSLYNFFKINISDNNEEFNTVIKKIFTVAEIRVRSINPIHYMYYNQNIFLPNIYPIIRPYIFGETKAISTTEKDKQLRVDVTQRINETNKQLMAVYKVPVRKTELRNYIITNWVVVTAFMVVAVLIYRKPILDLLHVNSLKELFGKIGIGGKEEEKGGVVMGTPVSTKPVEGEPVPPPPPPQLPPPTGQTPPLPGPNPPTGATPSSTSVNKRPLSSVAALNTPKSPKVIADLEATRKRASAITNKKPQLPPQQSTRI